MDGVNSFTCTCAVGFAGKTCSKLSNANVYSNDFCILMISIFLVDTHPEAG